MGAGEELSKVNGELEQARSRTGALDNDVLAKDRALRTAEQEKEDAVAMSVRRQRECDQLNGACTEGGGRGPFPGESHARHGRPPAADHVPPQRRSSR